MRPSHSGHLTIRQNEGYQDHPPLRFFIRLSCCHENQDHPCDYAACC